MIDLHTHSNESDGTDSPCALVDRAAAEGVTVLALTDHDTLSGVEAAAARAHEAGVEFVRGIELSARIEEETSLERRSAHVLGYFFNGIRGDFAMWLESLRVRRRERNAAMAEKLRELGLPVTLDEVEALGRNVAGRPHFARVMIAKRLVESREQAFREYLCETGAAYVERADPGVEEAIARIRQAGGVAVIAHPRRLNQPDETRERALLQRWRGAGLGGIEVWHPDHDEAAAGRYLALARKLGLAATGGSDYHGENKPEVRLGVGRLGCALVPWSAVEELRSRAGTQARG